MMLPPVEGSHVRLSMAPRDQWVLLVNTLLLPLCGFLAGTGITHLAFTNDLLTFAGALVGLGVGIAMCRRQSLESVVIEEVSSNE